MKNLPCGAPRPRSRGRRPLTSGSVPQTSSLEEVQRQSKVPGSSRSTTDRPTRPRPRPPKTPSPTSGVPSTQPTSAIEWPKIFGWPPVLPNMINLFGRQVRRRRVCSNPVREDNIGVGRGLGQLICLVPVRLEASSERRTNAVDHQHPGGPSSSRGTHSGACPRR
jgi:hypothetical protein